MSKRGASEGPADAPGPATKQPKLENGAAVKTEAKTEPEDLPAWACGKSFPQVLYKDSELLAALQHVYESNPEKQVEVLIPAEYISSSNRRVKTRQVWGDGVYTGDSDIVAALMHLGYLASTLHQPPPALLEVHAQLKLSPPLARYASRARFVKSRAWSSSIEGCSFQVEAAWMVTRSGSQIELKPCMEETSALHPTVHAQMSRQVATRGNAGRSIKVGQEVSVQFNLCNEPWLKYTLPAIADRGLKPAHWSSAQLLDDVLLLETQSTRFQVVRTGDVQGSAEGSPMVDVYSLSKCKVAAPAGKMRRLGMPLPLNHVEVLEEGLKWEEFLWGMSCVVVRGHRLPVRRMHFMLRAEAERDDA